MQGLLPIAYYEWMNELQIKLGPVTVILSIIAIALIGSFALSRICKLLKIPYVTAYIILGIILGPSLLAIIPSDIITGDGLTYAGLTFVSDITVGFIAFGCGKYFKWEHIKAGGKKVVLVSLTMALLVGLLTGLISYLFYAVIFGNVLLPGVNDTSTIRYLKDLGIAPALLIGSICACVSPTATSSIIRQYHAKGKFTERIFQNILVSNIVAILIFSLVLGLTSSGALGGLSQETTLSVGMTIYQAMKPIISNIFFSGIGILFALILSRLNNYKRTNDSRIIITIAFVAILVALCSVPYNDILNVLPLSKISPLLPCMVFGIVYLNLSKSEALFLQLDNFLPPILCLFFVISGAKLNLSNFSNWQYVIIAIVLILIRTISQIGSTRGVGKLFGCGYNTRHFLALTMFTMTSVAVGLIDLASVVLVNEPMIISFLYPVILTMCVVLEMVGPLFAKTALVRTNSVDPAYFSVGQETKKKVDEGMSHE